MSTSPAPSPALIGIPTAAAGVLALVGGILQVVNYSVVSAGSQLHSAIAVIILFLISLGITPLVGVKFRAALHLPSGVSYVVTAVVSAGGLALLTISMPKTTHEIIAAALTVLAALGFSASAEPVPVPPAV